MKTVELANGLQVPALGFGTWRLADGEEVIQAVTAALEAGYRHIDTAQTYKNEAGVGQAIKDSHVDRADIFLTTKIWNDQATYEGTIASFEESLKKLQTDYVDLLLVHWPNPQAYREEPGYQARNAEVWRALEDLYDQGLAKSIGISNFHQEHYQALAETARIKPMVNQIKLTPGLLQKDLVDFSKAHGMALEAYSPFGSGDLFANEEIKTLADKYQTGVAQLALTWALQHDFIVLPRSSNPDNIKANFDLPDLTISPEDMATLDNLDIDVECPDPNTKPF
ncbi:2,5-diketo-D-gluconic acid reductase [Aerococcus urinaehominis]|uniref:2,5-diketo-D-gluconic acid reductase n=1 Tax=Aerococcus urinaehominis TaxID=128944 RepID=A0A109RHI6_9LACT|nr:aldo/keto reductase [Aerococcus urinaehominis]AMB99951.1 2,5-diketo-D-gluconic acid reductase [Aerococcus urinaehominis]SDM64116.1 Aldo/keto reductase [Aerococcus urinaehominis]